MITIEKKVGNYILLCSLFKNQTFGRSVKGNGDKAGSRDCLNCVSIHFISVSLWVFPFTVLFELGFF